jgi:hypothetical protein
LNQDVIEQVEPALTATERLLTGRELGALRWARGHPQPKLSPDTQARLFALFLQNVDCIEIARLNKGLTLAQIVEARVDGYWDERRAEYQTALLKATADLVQQTTLESIQFVSLQIAAAHKQYGDQIKKYLQTGDVADLGSFSIHGFKQYREAVELLKTLTGADTKKHSGEILHRHEFAGNQQPTVAPTRPMKSIEAKAVVQQALARKKEQKEQGQ